MEMSVTSTQGHYFSGIEIKNSTVVLGNIDSSGGVTINSKTATSTGIAGDNQVSLRPVSTYVVRSALYEQLKARLHDTLDFRGVASKIVVVCGLGGAGKSQLVLHYIQTHRQDYSAVFWIEAGSKTTLERDYIQIWRLLYRSNEEKISIDDAVRGVKAWLQQQQEKRWLLVFDSADSIDDEAYKDYIDLNTFIPDASCVDAIITTRSQTAEDMTEIEAVQVGDLDKEEALELLLRCSKIKGMTENTKREAMSIVEELGHFALAVALAGAYIAATPRIRSRLETYLPEYRQRRKTLLGRKAQRQVHRYGESVLTTWETSYAAIASQRPEALGLLRLLAFLSPDDIFYELFTPLLGNCSKSASIWVGTSEAVGTDDVVTQDTLDSGFEVLSKYSLLSWKEEQSSFAMHKLVHTWGYERMAVEEQVKHGQEALEFIDDLLTSQSHGPMARARLVPHLMANFSRLQEWFVVTDQVQEKSLKSLATCSYFLRDSGQFNQGVIICQLRCEASRRLHCDDSKIVLDADHDLALMYWHQGQYEAAEELQVKVLEIRKRVLGEEHLHTLTSMNNLAVTYSNQGRYEAAEELGVKALEIMKRVLGEEHPDTLRSMNNLASTYSDQGRYEAAEELQMKVVEIRKRVLGEEHPDTLTSMGNLVLTYSNQGRYEAAEELGVKVVEIKKRVLGEEHPDTLTSMDNLASTYSDQGRYEAAEELQVKVMEIMKRVLGEEHPDTLMSMNNLASTYSNQGRYEAAEELGVKVVEIAKKVLGEEHPDTLTSMNNLAVTFFHQGKLQDALKLMRQCVQSQSAVLGEGHPCTVLSVGRLRHIEMEMQAASSEETEVNVADLTIADADADAKEEAA